MPKGEIDLEVQGKRKKSFKQEKGLQPVMMVGSV